MTLGGGHSPPLMRADGNNLCIVMEYCGWGDLAMKIKRYIKRREYIDERVIWVYLIQILEGLKALHERNVLHRGKSPHSLPWSRWSSRPIAACDSWLL